MGCSRVRKGRILGCDLREERIEIDRVDRHADGPVLQRPFGAQPVAVQLQAVAIQIGKVESLADQVIGLAEWDLGGDKLANLDCQRAAVRE